MFWEENEIKPDPTGADAELRQRFVEEFIYDRDPVRAANRLGFTGQWALTYAEEFMREPYVQRLIKEEELKFAERLENKDPILRARIVASLFHESQTAVKCATRVAALNKLVNMCGLDETLTEADATEHVGGRIYINVRPGRNKDSDYETREEGTDV